MARIIRREAKAPYRLQEGDKKSICMCGLSDNQPFCNGAHKETKDEEDGKLYEYQDGERVEVEVLEK